MKVIPDIEVQSREKIKSFQEDKLRELLAYLSKCSPFYQGHFAKHQINIDSIRLLEDLESIPPTTKDDLQTHHWDFLCRPKREIAEYTSTSGTLGKPVTIALTHKDVERLAYNESISFACAGCSSDDVFQLMLTLDRQFMAGMAYYEGVRKLGAGIVRTGPGLPGLQWETIARLQSTVLIAVPSFLVTLTEYAIKNGISLNESAVRRAVCIGESLRTEDFHLNALGKRITEHWNIHLAGTYASTEMQTAFTECEQGNGGHHHPELIIVELLDRHDKPVEDGEAGEVTVTTLGVEGMPLVRYKTGDLCRAFYEPCPCGRTTMRLGPVLGRKQQMIKLKGTTIYPPAVFEVINQVAGVADYVVEVFTNKWGLDDLRIHLIAPEEGRLNIEEDIRNSFYAGLRVTPEIIFSTTEEIQKIQMAGTGRKINRLVDRRKPVIGNQ